MVAQTAIFRDLRGTEKMLNLPEILVFCEEKHNNLIFLEHCREVTIPYRNFQKTLKLQRPMAGYLWSYRCRTTFKNGLKEQILYPKALIHSD